MKEKEFIGYNKKILNLYIWDAVEHPRAVVQIIHDMQVHCGIYNEFAGVLNEAGFIVVGSDLRCHGKSEEVLGVSSSGDYFNSSVLDVVAIGNNCIEQYKLPLFVYGHGYGSFISQRYAQVSSLSLQGLILSGSARLYKHEIAVAWALLKAQSKLYGDKKPAKLAKFITTGKFDWKYRNDKLKSAWISEDAEVVKAYNECDYNPNVMSIGFYKSLYEALGVLYSTGNLSTIRKDLPILIVSGDDDAFGGYGKKINDLYDTYVDASLRDVELRLYQGARHELHNGSKKEAMYNDVIEFVNKNLAPNN